MSVRAYVEGGGYNKDTLKRCNEGFARYCAKLAPSNRRPGIVACGGRRQAFDRFCTAIQNGKPGETFVLLVDSEGRVGAGSPSQHLHARDGWDFPPLNHHQVFLMVQAMEAWFLADRDALAEFYGQGFPARSLPGTPTDIEAVSKGDLEPRLAHASKPTQKGEYQKVKHGFALLALIHPAKVERASPHAKRFHDFLRAL